MQQFLEIEKGITLAAGLKWLPISSQKTRDRNREIQSLTETFAADLIVSLKKPYQIGLANSLSGYKASMLSMAAAVSDSVQKKFGASTFHCAFQIRDGIWGYVAVQNKTILPTITGVSGDMIGTEDEVRNMFTSVRAKMPLDLEIAPQSWETDDSINVPFQELIPHRKNGRIISPAHWKLHSFQKGQRQKLALLIMCIILLGLAGWYWHHNNQIEQANAARQARLAAAKNKKAVHPWKNQPRATVFANACESALNNVPYLFPSGWVFNSAICGQRDITLTWNRQSDGKTTDFLLLYPTAKLSDDGNNAFLKLPVDMKTGEDEQIENLADRKTSMIKTASDVNFTLTIDKGEKRELPGKKKAAISRGNWKKFIWKLKNSPVSPAKAVAKLEAPGLRLTTIQTTMKNGLFVWNLEGEQYGN